MSHWLPDDRSRPSFSDAWSRLAVAFRRPRIVLALAVVILALLAGRATRAQGPGEPPSPQGSGWAERATAASAGTESAQEDDCLNPAAICIPDGVASVIFTFTGSTDCHWSYGVDWGDGSPRETSTHVGPGEDTITHQYAEPGEYEVAATGTGSPANCVFTNGTLLYEYPCSMADTDYGELAGWQFGPYPVLRLRARTYQVNTEAGFYAAWDLCPNASLQNTETGMEIVLDDGGVAASVNATPAGITFSSRYSIEEVEDVVDTVYGFDPEPYFELDWTRGLRTRGQALALEEEGNLNSRFTIHPDQVLLMCVWVAAFASSTSTVAALLSASQRRAVLEAMAAWIRGLELRYPGILSAAALVAPEEVRPPRDRLAPAETVLDDVAAVFGPSFIETSTVETLALDGTEKAPGDSIGYAATGMTPDEDVLLMLIHVNDPETLIIREVVADGNGEVSGAISLPADAGPGHWLVAAVNMPSLRQSLQAFVDADGDSDALAYNLAANTVVLPGSALLPLVMR